MFAAAIPLAGTVAAGAAGGSSGILSGLGAAAGGFLGAAGGFLKDFAGPIGNVLGGIFGGGDAPPPPGLKLLQLRKDAAAAGFNPLTVLAATGGAGYARQPEVPSWLSIASGLVGPALTEAFENSEERKNGEIARALMEAQIRALNLENIRVSRPLGGSVWYDGAIGDFPALTGAALGGGSSRAQRSGALDGPLSVVADTEATAPMLFGYRIKPVQRNSDAEVIETRYGEAGGLFFGLSNLAEDIWNTIKLSPWGEKSLGPIKPHAWTRPVN